ncbi:bifunctional YncE family protein/alkaline phosphatase family protein [Nocardioides sp.]|uniref:bifunctional YncE family protein/alkaline phosphatase family protein n=1 Tax=Nocardioides sp. TaxID=35761 RepID=UPI00262500AF|nr:bifunctional YncE family protein/alkaline phosphatase family protein [Nocardioides sp.]
MHVTRQRRSSSRVTLGFLSQCVTGRRRYVVAGATALALASGGVAAYASTVGFGTNQVGTTYAAGLQVSDNQLVKPLGDRLMTPFGKFMGSTISPDGRYLAATSSDRSVAVQIFDLQTYQPVAAAGTAAVATFASTASGAGFSDISYQKIGDGTVGQAAPTYSPDGTSLWVGVATGLIRYPVNADGTLGTGVKVAIPTVGGHQALTGATAFSADGTTLFAAVNGQNTVVAIDPATGTITQTWAVGVAPRALSVVGNRVYVTNEGGRQATAGDTTMDSYGTKVVADTTTGAATTGTVSVIDPTSTTVGTIKVGLHPTSTYVAGTTLYVVNTNSDSVSVIDTTKGKVVQTINTQPWSGSTVGYTPTGVTVSGGRLLVTLARANAVAVYRLDRDPKAPVSYVGLLPTDYYPSAIASTKQGLVVTNRRGIDARGPLITFNKGTGTTPATGHGTHATTASLTRFTLPSDKQIAASTSTVFAQNGWTGNSVAQAGKHAKKAVAVPKKIGDPSTIKHVFLLVKENRTYDQVYGDMTSGNGDATLAQFGEQVTPNQHALARQFGLYDNLYDVGTNSAEGHNWLMQGDNPEYTESSVGEYTRSYDTEEDVLGHQRSGFLWTAVAAAGKSARNFGEFIYTEGKPAGSTWQQYYCASKDVMSGGDSAQLTSPALKGNYGSVIPSLDKITNRTSPPFDTAIPDIYRAQVWKSDFEKNGPAALNMMWLSSDHTGGTAGPRAQVADGDLAVGQVVDTISHSKYWKDSAIFVVEDDSQDGADHVDGHRAPVQVISPYAVHGKTVSTYYSQINMVRTIEQILGAQPLNAKVAAATPMYDAFTQHADLTPYTAVANQVPLTEGVATAPSCGLDTLGLSGAAATKLNAAEAARTAVPASAKAVAAKWDAWQAHQQLTGNGARADYAHPEQMNRWTWYQTHHFTTPYPGDSTIYAPDDVPGGYIPNADAD